MSNELFPDTIEHAEPLNMDEIPSLLGEYIKKRCIKNNKSIDFVIDRLYEIATSPQHKDCMNAMKFMLETCYKKEHIDNSDKKVDISIEYKVPEKNSDAKKNNIT